MHKLVDRSAGAPGCSPPASFAGVQHQEAAAAGEREVQDTEGVRAAGGAGGGEEEDVRAPRDAQGAAAGGAAHRVPLSTRRVRPERCRSGPAP
jgi:hypothetical protein